MIDIKEFHTKELDELVARLVLEFNNLEKKLDDAVEKLKEALEVKDD